MTSDVLPAGGGGPSSSTLARARVPPRTFSAADFFLAAVARPDFLAAGRAALPLPATRRATGCSSSSAVVCFGSFFRAMLSVNGSVIGRRPGGIVPRAFHECPQVVERDPPVELQQRSLDEVLELRGG